MPAETPIAVRSAAASGERLSAILSGNFVASGVAIDDESQDLMQSIEQYAKDQGTPIKIKTVTSAKRRDRVVKLARKSDFVLVDHRLQGKFHGYDDGLEVLDSVRAQDAEQPIFYCSAFPQDFQDQGDGEPRLIDRVDVLVRSPHTFFYPKEELNVKRRLKEFTQAVYWQSFGYAMHNLVRGTKMDEVKKWLTMKQTRNETRVFKLLGPAAKGWTRVRELAEKHITTEELVPTRLLKRSGIKSKFQHAEHIIIEYDGGEILSFFRPVALGKDRVSPRVIAALTSGDKDD